MQTATMHRVTFKGADRTVEAHDGELVLALAKRSGLHIDSSCGGNGSCHQCRIVIHEGRPMREGKPTPARHRRGNQPVYLACQCEVHGDMVVEPAPTHGLRARPKASLLGWNVGASADGPRTVVDPGVITGAEYVIDAGGNFIAESGFDASTHRRPAEAWPTPEVALARGTEHLHEPRRIVLDFSGRMVSITPDETASIAIEIGAFAGTMAHVAGAIERVEWSPLKTRTILDTVGRQKPLGISTNGILSLVQALLQAGMCDADLKLRESRFTRRKPTGDVELVLVAPGVEAQSSVGEIWTSAEPLTVSQGKLDEIREAAHGLRHVLAALDFELLVVTGEFGTYVDPGLIRALGISDKRVEFVPHAAALGAARLAFSQPDAQP
jgi:ferredoxin